MFKPLLTAMLLFAVSLPAAECKHRGVWFWQDTGNLCHWQEILRVKSQQSGPMAVPVRFDNAQGFWRIERFSEP